MTTIQTRPDDDAERILKELNLKFTLKEVQYSQIDIKMSLQNMARVTGLGGQAVDESKVEDYLGCMKQGHIFPHPVLLATDRKYITLGGNHRFAAWARLNGDSDFLITSYVLDGKDLRERDLVPRMLNNRHGLRTPVEHRLFHAQYAVTQHGWKVSKAEQAFGLSTGSLSKYRAEEECRRRIIELDRNPTDIGKSVLAPLGAIKNPLVFAPLTKLLCKMGPKMGKEAMELVSKVKSETTQGAQQAAIEVSERFYALSDPKALRPVGIKTKFLRQLGGMEKIIQGKKRLTQFQVTDEKEIQEIIKRLKALSSWIKHVCNSI